MRHIKKEGFIALLFLFPSLAGFMVFYIIPYMGSIYYSLTEGIGGRFAGLGNYKDLFQSKSFLLAFKNTMAFNLLSVPAVIIISLAFALLLNNKLTGISSLKTFFIIPLVIPVSSVILFWQLLFSENGMINYLFKSVNIDAVNWLQSDNALGVLALLFIWKNTGYDVIIFLAGLNQIPKDYYEYAYMDGGSKIKCFFAITVPLLVPTGFFIFIISMINAFKIFREAYLLAGNYPHQSMYMLQHFINNNFYNLSYPRLTTAAFIMTVLIAAIVYVFFVVQEYYRDKIV